MTGNPEQNQQLVYSGPDIPPVIPVDSVRQHLQYCLNRLHQLVTECPLQPGDSAWNQEVAELNSEMESARILFMQTGGKIYPSSIQLAEPSGVNNSLRQDGAGDEEGNLQDQSMDTTIRHGSGADSKLSDAWRHVKDNNLPDDFETRIQVLRAITHDAVLRASDLVQMVSLKGPRSRIRRRGCPVDNRLTVVNSVLTAFKQMDAETEMWIWLTDPAAEYLPQPVDVSETITQVLSDSGFEKIFRNQSEQITITTVPVVLRHALRLMLEDIHPLGIGYIKNDVTEQGVRILIKYTGNPSPGVPLMRESLPDEMPGTNSALLVRRFLEQIGADARITVHPRLMKDTQSIPEEANMPRNTIVISVPDLKLPAADTA